MPKRKKKKTSHIYSTRMQRGALVVESRGCSNHELGSELTAREINNRKSDTANWQLVL